MKTKHLTQTLLLGTAFMGASVMANTNANLTATSIQIPAQTLTITQTWDKVFAKSDKVVHRKVSFVNRYGITLVADLYIPKNAKGKLPAIATAGPFGAVKEQVSGLYAQTLAERGFITLAFDPSFTGESGGEPRGMASPNVNSEDFSAAIDFLGTQELVDRERIGVLGICGFGGMGLNATSLDSRIKAYGAVSLYDMSRSIGLGVGDGADAYTGDDRKKVKEHLAQIRWSDVDNKTISKGLHELPVIDGKVVTGELILPKVLPDNPHPVLAQFYEYYRTKRGFHKNSLNSDTAWSAVMPTAFMTMPMDSYAHEIDVPVLMVIGENAHSAYFSQDIYKKLTGTRQKELYVVPNAHHVDMYDNVQKIPFDKLEQFFKASLK